MNSLSLNTISYIQTHAPPFIAKHLSPVRLVAFSAIALIAVAYASIRLVTYTFSCFFPREIKYQNPISQSPRQVSQNNNHIDEEADRGLQITPEEAILIYDEIDIHTGNEYLIVEEGQLEIISFREFDDLAEKEKKIMLELLEKLI